MELVKDDGTLVVNRDEPAWDALVADGDGCAPSPWTPRPTCAPRTSTPGRRRVRASRWSRTELRADVELPLLGRYNVENALAAAAVALVGRDGAGGRRRRARARSPSRRDAWRRCSGALHRAHRLRPHARRAARARLGAVKPLTQGRLIVVFGAGGDRDRLKRRPMAEAVRRFADVVVLTSDNPRTEDPERILDDLAMGLEGLDYARIADRRAAIRHALEIAREGDTVVLAGKGHETYQVLGREKRPFDERVVVRECLAELGVA